MKKQQQVKTINNQQISKTISFTNRKICNHGHVYFKSSNCPTCPVCEAAKKPIESFLSVLAAPARRALENNGINTLKKLSTKTEGEILQLHGLGPATMPILRNILKANKLSFKKYK